MGSSILFGTSYYGQLSVFTKCITSYIFCLLIVLVLSLSLIIWCVVRKYNPHDDKYKLLVENSLDTIALIKNGKWEYINPSGIRLFEADSEKKLIGASIYTLLDESDHSAMSGWLMAERDPKQPAVVPIELKWRTFGGKIVLTEAVRITGSFGKKQMQQIVIRDISERKKNEEKLIRSEKLSVAGQLAAGIAHEIRNPLTSLKGFLQLIATGRTYNNRYYSIMKSELLRIESIISGLLMLSKPQVYNYIHIDLRKLMLDTVEQLQMQGYPQHIRMVYREDHRPLWVRGVEVQLRQVFINVLKNAIEAMENGGVITIELSLETDDGKVSIRIQDEGTGIPKEQLAKIGQPFYTTKDKGTGLGLMVTYKIIDNHHGHIAAESEVGVGTTFTIQLPYQSPTRSPLNVLHIRA